MYNKFVICVEEDAKVRKTRYRSQRLFDVLSDIVKEYKEIDRNTLMTEIHKRWGGQPSHAYRYTLIFWSDVKKEKFVNIKFYNDKINWID